MSSSAVDTVLIVCSDEEYSSSLTTALFDAGANVIGPVSRANMALALAAQSSPNVAIVARPPTGRRGATELARDLMDTWGVRSLILAEALPDDDTDQPWSPNPGELARLRAAIDTLKAKAVAS